MKALASKDQNGTVKIVMANFDIYGKHSETVPVTITNLPSGSYTVTKEFHNGQVQSNAASVSDGTLATDIYMAPNTVVLVTITKK